MVKIISFKKSDSELKNKFLIKLVSERLNIQLDTLNEAELNYRFIYLSPNSNTKNTSRKIGIASTKEFISKIHYKSDNSIAIIDNAQFLTIEAQNSLLKSLEEFPDSIHLYIFTESINKIIPTVLSRCIKEDLIFLTKEESKVNFSDLRYNKERENNSQIDRVEIGYIIEFEKLTLYEKLHYISTHFGKLASSEERNYADIACEFLEGLLKYYYIEGKITDSKKLLEFNKLIEKSISAINNGVTPRLVIECVILNSSINDNYGRNKTKASI